MKGLEALQSARVVAVIRAPARESLVPITSALLEGGIRAIEVTLSTPDAIQGIRDLEREFGDAILLGVGTVLLAETVGQAADAGASFVVSPVFVPAVVQATRNLGLLSLPGAFTPTEVLRAWNEGADVVKVFPAGTLGPGYFKDLLAPMPFLRLMPTGGVEAANVGAWIEAGAFAVGAGSSLLPKKLVQEGRWAEITALAKSFAA